MIGSRGWVSLDFLLDRIGSPWVIGPLAFIVWCVGLTIVMKVAYNRVRRLADRTATDLDNIVLKALRAPLAVVILATGGMVLGKILPLSPEWDRTLGLGVKVTVILAGVLFFDALVKALLWRQARRAEHLRTSAGIMQTAVRGVIILIAVLIILDTAGVSITPLVASLGVASLAVALALQPPLTNFFAGIQLLADRPVEVGHYIRLGSGEEGYVTKIGWRSTTIRAIGNNLIVIPNSKLMDSNIVNYDLPAREMSVTIQVGVHYDSDLEQVERVAREVGLEVLREVEGGKKDFTPLIRFHTFGDSSINLTVILMVDEFIHQYALKSEFVKRLHKRFKQERIVIPFPIRTLDIKQEDLLLLKRDAPS
jgi:small-conductance mechanosensitive channel